MDFSNFYALTLGLLHLYIQVFINRFSDFKGNCKFWKVNHYFMNIYI